MKLQIQIPRGWRRLKKGEKIAGGDMAPSNYINAWIMVHASIGYCVHEGHIYIRRIAKRPRKRWRMLKVGEVCPRNYEVRVNGLEREWSKGTAVGAMIKNTDGFLEFRAPVRGKGGK